MFCMLLKQVYFLLLVFLLLIFLIQLTLYVIFKGRPIVIHYDTSKQKKISFFVTFVSHMLHFTFAISSSSSSVRFKTFERRQKLSQ